MNIGLARINTKSSLILTCHDWDIRRIPHVGVWISQSAQTPNILHASVQNVISAGSMGSRLFPGYRTDVKRAMSFPLACVKSVQGAGVEVRSSTLTLSHRWLIQKTSSFHVVLWTMYEPFGVCSQGRIRLYSTPCVDFFDAVCSGSR